jgi:hypothetical protein
VRLSGSRGENGHQVGHLIVAHARKDQVVRLARVEALDHRRSIDAATLDRLAASRIEQQEVDAASEPHASARPDEWVTS